MPESFRPIGRLDGDSATVTERIRAATDIVDLVSAHVAMKRVGSRFRALCPFHNEKTPSFYVNPQRQIFKCFGCGAGGDVFTFVQLREGVEFPEAKALLADRAGISLSPPARVPGGSAETFGRPEMFKINRWACERFQQWLAADAGRSAREYAAHRGLSQASLDRFRIGLAPSGWDALVRAAKAGKLPMQALEHLGLIKRREADGTYYDCFRNRLMVPIEDAMGRIIGFGGRALDDSPAKYVNSPQNSLFDKSRCLFGVAAAREAWAANSVAVLMEGYLDCILAHQHGITNAVATLGTAMTDGHVSLLRRYVDRVVVVFDSDEAGRKAANAALAVLVPHGVDVRVAALPDGRDPADLLAIEGSDALEAVLTSSVDALRFKWNQVCERYRHGETGVARREAIEEFLALIARWATEGACSAIQRGLIANQVAKLLGLTAEEVHQQIRQMAKRPNRPAEGLSNTPGVWRPPPAKNAADAAMRWIIEVVLNDASHFAAASAYFEPEKIADASLRQVARLIQESAEQNAGWTPAELLGRLQTVEAARWVTACQAAGEARGNYEETVAGAVRRLQEIRDDHLGDESRRRFSLAAGRVEPREATASTTECEPSAGQAVIPAAELSPRGHRFADRRHLSMSGRAKRVEN